MSSLHKYYALQKYMAFAEATCCDGRIECGACGHAERCVLVTGHDGAHCASTDADTHYFHVWAKANKPEWYDSWVNKTGEWAE